MRALRHQFARAVKYGDPILVALLALTALLQVLISGAALMDAVIAGAIALPLLARRRAPLLTLLVLIAAGYAGYARGRDVGGSLQAWISLNVALYSVAARCEFRREIA